MIVHVFAKCTCTCVSFLKIAVVIATIVCRRCPYIVLGFLINQTTRKISKVLLICHLIIEATPTLCEQQVVVAKGQHTIHVYMANRGTK